MPTGKRKGKKEDVAMALAPDKASRMRLVGQRRATQLRIHGVALVNFLLYHKFAPKKLETSTSVAQDAMAAMSLQVWFPMPGLAISISLGDAASQTLPKVRALQVCFPCPPHPLLDLSL